MISPYEKVNGFTLVELLVVCAIISILAGILLPVLKNARDAAYGVTCMNNNKQIGVTFILYLNDNRGFFPPYRNGGVPEKFWYDKGSRGQLAEYVDNRTIGYLSIPSGKDLSSCAFWCPSEPVDRGRDQQWCYAYPSYPYLGSVRNIKYPAKKGLVADAKAAWMKYDVSPGHLADRHNDKLVTLLADIHVETKYLSEVLIFKPSYDAWRFFWRNPDGKYD